MSEKTYVALQQAICPVCANKHDTGVIINRRLEKTFEPKIVTHWQMCPEHEKLKSEGYVALVGIDPAKSDGTKLHEVFRTGSLAFLKADRWSDVFDIPEPEHGVCYAENAVIDMLAKASPNSDDQFVDSIQQSNDC